MLPMERRNRIMELIRSEKNMRISELSEELGVSEMTVHRDIKPLIEEGLVTKTFGGISLTQEKAETGLNQQECVYCHRTVNQRTAYRLIRQNHRIETTCCAHCGLLRHRQLGKEILQALCSDFLLQTTISAATAWFVMDTSLNMGCCQPQVLAFEHKTNAEKFAQGFGGKIYSFTDALEAIYQRMIGEQPGCCTIEQ